MGTDRYHRPAVVRAGSGVGLGREAGGHLLKSAEAADAPAAGGGRRLHAVVDV